MIIETHFKNHNWVSTVADEPFELYCAGKVWEEELLSSLQNENLNFKDATAIIKEMTGFFALVYQCKNQLIAAVDHTRSIPLFYGVKNKEFYISDQAEWVREKVKSQAVDQVAKEEFQMLGYVLGNKTLYPSVKQLQAGECLAIANGVLEVKQYYTFQHVEPVSFNEIDFLNELDSISVNSINRLIKYAAGRQIVVPLSGGYDSRLIVSLLKKVNYKNVICFSYGVIENKESSYSQKIAQALDYEWLFVEYTDTFWKEAWASQEAAEFRDFASNHSSLPHIQDWLALKKLKNNPAIENDAVFVPGHCCVTDYIPENILSKKMNNTFYFENIIQTHFTGRPFSLNKILDAEKVKEILYENKRINNLNDAASEIMTFNWQERQAKYITNSVRVYEQFGFDWWLPLWDQEFMMLWEKVPIKSRLNRSLYISYVNSVFESEKKTGFFDKEDNASDVNKNKIWLKNLLKKLFPELWYEYFLNKYREKSNRIAYKNHFLKFESLMSSDDMKFYIESNYTIIGMYSDLFLKKKWGKYS